MCGVSIKLKLFVQVIKKLIILYFLKNCLFGLRLDIVILRICYSILRLYCAVCIF